MELEKKYGTREEWLDAAVKAVRPLIKAKTKERLTPQKPIRISVGFPPSGGRNRNNGMPGTVGVCMPHQHSKYAHIFIHPHFDKHMVLADKGVMEIITHETIHACLPDRVGHRKQFSQAAKQVGLVGKPRATLLSDELREELKPIVRELGEYPHDEGVSSSGTKQTTRMKKMECPGCGCIAYMTRLWLDSIGPLKCPQCDLHLIEGGVDDGEKGERKDPLIIDTVGHSCLVKATPEQRKKGLKTDPRFAVRMRKQGRDVRFWIVYYGDGQGDFVKKPDGTFVTDDEGNPVRKAHFGIVHERLVTAESREDAIANIEALQDSDDPNAFFGELEANDNDPDLNGDEDELAGEYGEDDSDVGDELTPDEQVEYDQQEREREIGRAKVAPRMIDFDLDKRIAELERLGGAA